MPRVSLPGPGKATPQTAACPVFPPSCRHCEALAGRILAEEHIAYSKARSRVASGNYVLEGRRDVLRAAK